MNRVYVCIDLKSFYASVECRERNLNPLTTNLVVADESRTSKTVCLAITPTLKQYGLSGRERLFEVLKKVNDVNKQRLYNAPNHKFTAKSYEDTELKKDKSLELDLLIVPPRMAYYMEYSINIYQIYLKYLSKDDIYVYSIDEVFCDITNYLHMYNMNAKELVTKIIKDIYDTTGITATAGIGTNLYLAKVAMDIVAKHVEANEFGVRIAELNYKLNIIGKHLKEQNSVSITYFMPDIKKNGGKYQTISGIIKKIDNTEHVVIFENEIKIPLCDIIEISGKFLDELE